MVDQASYAVGVDPDPSRTHLELQVTSVQAIWDPVARIVPEPRTLVVDDSGLLLGGHEFTIWPAAVREYASNPQVMVAASSTLTPEGGTPIPLGVRIVPGNKNFDQFAIAIPDLDGRAQLDLHVQWKDQCFVFTATASQAVTVVPLSATRTCHLDQDHWIDDLAGVFDQGITVDSTMQRIFPIDLNARFANQGAGGDPPNFAVDWKAHPGGVSVAPGARLEIYDGATTRHSTAVDAELFTRADMLRVAADEAAMVSPIWTLTPNPRTDGSFSIKAPSAAGRYVLEVRFDFTSTCLTGVATSVFSVDVR